MKAQIKSGFRSSSAATTTKCGFVAESLECRTLLSVQGIGASGTVLAGIVSRPSNVAPEVSSTVAAETTLPPAVASGDRVAANGNVNVRKDPGGSLITTEGSGSQGTITNGPSGANYGGTFYEWWEVQWDDGTLGWSVQDGLTSIQPTAPTLNSPGSPGSPGPVLSTLTPTLNWSAVGGATNYGVYVKDLGTGALVYNNDSAGNVTSLTLPSGTLTAGDKYAWNARASDSAGFGQFSAAYYFQTSVGNTAFGAVLGSFNGVANYSNGSGTYVSNVDNVSSGINTGMEWQCVEYVNRYYYQVYGINIRVPGDNANQYFAGASVRGLLSYPNGGASAPQVGDILCFAGGTDGSGHVAIVRTVGSNYIDVIQQNVKNGATGPNGSDDNYSFNFDAASDVVDVQTPGSSHLGTTYYCQGWLRLSTRLLAPSLVSPANQQAGVSEEPQFSWSQVSGNQGYRIIVSANAADLTADPTQPGNLSPVSGFNQTVVQNQTTYSWSGSLTGSTTYYWEVHALGSSTANAGIWSNQQSFTTGSQTLILGADFNADAGSANWPAEQSGRSFLYVKAAQGDNPNSFLPSNISSVPAITSTFTFGLFDFADPDEYANPATRVADPANATAVTADAQAAANSYYAKAAPYLTAGHLLPALDLEDEYGTGGFKSPYAAISGYPSWSWQDIAEWTAAWATQLSKDNPNLGAPILYMTQGYAENISPQMINGYLPAPISFPLWVADTSNNSNIDPNPSIGSWPNWVIEQYDQSGPTPPGDFDVLNTSNGQSISSIEIASSVKDNPPLTPTNVAPSDGSLGEAVTPTLTASAFADPDPGDVEAAGEWQVIRKSDNSVIWDSSVDTTDLTIVTIPASAGLAYGTSYLWHVRYQDSHGLWSGYSSETSFTTLVQEPQVSVQLGSTTIQSNQTAAVDFGSVNQGQAPVSLSFTVQNAGQAPLTLGLVSVPSGYTVAKDLASPLSSGSSEQFSVELDTDTGGTRSGNISFTTNDPNTPTFSFPVTGYVVPPTYYTISISSYPTSGGTTAGAGSFVGGYLETVTATPNSGFSFVDWTENGTDVSGSASYSFTVAGNRNLVANFTAGIATTTTIASGLTSPSQLIVSGGEAYFVENTSTDGTINEVSAAGGPVTTVATGLALVDSGSLRGIGPYTLSGSVFYGGYGGYSTTNVFSVPVTGGTATTLASVSGGSFVGVIGNSVYYSSNFSGVNAMPLGGGTVTTFASGDWVRNSAVDSGAVYYIDYSSKDLRKLDVTTGTVTPLITGRTTEAGVFVDASHVFLNTGADIEEVAKTGGPVTTLVTSATATGYCSDGSYVYFIDGTSLERVPVAGGTPTILATVPANAASGVAVDANNVYWIDSSGGAGAAAIRRLSLPGSTSGFITGSVFTDANNNGKYDGGEPALKGVTAYIDSNNNGTYDPGEPTAPVDLSGTYTFANLAPGSYRIREIVPSGYAETAPLAYGQSVQLAAGQTAQGPVFGDTPISSVTMNLGYFLTLTRNFGQPGTFAAGDLNGDGTVNLADLLLLTRNFGHALPASAVAGATPAAPATIPARVVRRR